MFKKLTHGLYLAADTLNRFFIWLTPLASLLARCWVGYVFLNSGLLKLAFWPSTVALFTYEFQVPFINPELAAIMGAAAEIGFPILIILGLGGRLSVAGLFIFNIIAVISYPFLWTPDGWPGLIQHLNWGIILLLLLCYGTGPWSLDKLVQYGYNRTFAKKTD